MRMTVFGRDLEERGEDRGKLDPVKKAVKLQNGVSVKMIQNLLTWL